MSDYVHSHHRSKGFGEGGSVESRVIFVALWIVFFARAVVSRMLPWRAQKKSADGESVFSEARTAAAVCLASSFVGL